MVEFHHSDFNFEIGVGSLLENLEGSGTHMWFLVTSSKVKLSQVLLEATRETESFMYHAACIRRRSRTRGMLPREDASHVQQRMVISAGTLVTDTNLEKTFR